jgi:hypothetical protein
MANKNRLKLYFFPSYSKSESWKNWLVFSVSILSGIAAVATTIFLIATEKPDDRQKSVARVILIFWSILPPIYFWVEYFIIWKTSEKKSPTLDEFKHGQEICRNIWLAFVLLFAGLYFKNF